MRRTASTYETELRILDDRSLLTSRQAAVRGRVADDGDGERRGHVGPPSRKILASAAARQRCRIGGGRSRQADVDITAVCV